MPQTTCSPKAMSAQLAHTEGSIEPIWRDISRLSFASVMCGVKSALLPHSRTLCDSKRATSSAAKLETTASSTGCNFAWRTLSRKQPTPWNRNLAACGSILASSVLASATAATAALFSASFSSRSIARVTWNFSAGTKPAARR